MEEKKLFLLDAMALIYRAHFAFIKNPRLTSKGVNTSAVFGFTNSLLDILSNQKPTHLGVAFDTPAPTFRHEDFPEYKANREEIPEDIADAIPMVKRLLGALNIPVLEMDGYEADDIIGTLARRAEQHGYTVYMVTPDKDFAQLVTQRVLLYKPARMGNEIEILDPDKVLSNMGVTPEHVTDFLGLKGDAVDNIPGIPKVGDKTAVELINMFGTVENIVRRAEEIEKKSIRETVIQFGEQGILSKKLATIMVNAPVKWNEENLKIGNPDRDGTLAVLRDLEFKTIASRILGSSIFGGETQTDLFGRSVETPDKQLPPSADQEMPSSFQTLANRKHEYVLIRDKKALEKLVAVLLKSKQFCFDTETTGLDPLTAELVALTLSTRPGEGFMLHFPAGQKDVKEWLEILKPALNSPKIIKIGQNLKYDMLVLKNLGIEVKPPFLDTMLAHYVIDPDKSHSMDSMARTYLRYDPIPISELIGKKGKEQTTMRDVEVSKLLDYACEDADITMELATVLEPKLDETDVRKVLEEVELPLLPVLTEMEFAGVRIDQEFLRHYSKELAGESAKAESEIYRMAGTTFNINSPKQLGEIIFDKLKLATGSKTKTGQYSTREEVLVSLATQHDLPAQILRFRKLGKLKSTYVDALPEIVNLRTGRVHSTFSQAVTATGRLSSNNPNLQNIPIRTEEGREIRKAFIPADGFELCSADYSQVELRLMAALSGDEGMKEAFALDQDIHRATASKVFGVKLEDVTDDMRAKSKMVNFGIIYGISAFGLAQRLGISRTDAGGIISNYFSKYPGIREYMDGRIAFAREKGFATTIMGRRRYLPDIRSRNQTTRGFAERNAINTPIQGSAAELIKLAMIGIQKHLWDNKCKSRMILQVHDELVFEIHPKEKAEMKKMIREKMETAMNPGVAMKVEMGFGKNWLEAH